MSVDGPEYAYIPLLIERLKTLGPYKVILFGSRAYGTPDKDSDIDLMVVLDTEKMPRTFRENLDNKLLVRNALWELSTRVSIDLIVYTKPMYEKFIELDSMFAREISQRGKALYEADNT
ncbi:MAG: nucleotidyltransferase domain-containing protein [Chloroflexi bacterium]|nr:MAG: nucleotidyltransferase domain-containing protein [Chloroflexota bacterium]RLC87731.1 MAG: nucleotidyltransferase domain-containing protein [Chloroflexota bacterium]